MLAVSSSVEADAARRSRAHRPLATASSALDGGAMFGVVPQAAVGEARAGRRSQPDSAGDAAAARRDGDADRCSSTPGCGDKMDAKSADIYGIDRTRTPRSRAGRGRRVAPTTSTSCSPSHLHFDHAGGFTRRDGGRRASRRAFRSARYVAQRGEWDDATHPHERNRAAIFAENFVPLAGRRRADLRRRRRARSCRASACARTGGHTHAPSDRHDRVATGGRPCSRPT